MSAKVVMLPGGRRVGLGVYVKAWKALKAMPPGEEVKGWNWYPVPAGEVLAAMREGIDDRINLRGGLVLPAKLPARVDRRMWDVRVAAARARGCWCCGSPVPADMPVNPNANGGRVYCSAECRAA